MVRPFEMDAMNTAMNGQLSALADTLQVLNQSQAATQQNLQRTLKVAESLVEDAKRIQRSSRDFASTLEPDLQATYGRMLFREEFSCLMRKDHPALENGGQPLSVDQFVHWPHIAVLVGETGFDRINTQLGERAAER